MRPHAGRIGARIWTILNVMAIVPGLRVRGAWEVWRSFIHAETGVLMRTLVRIMVVQRLVHRARGMNTVFVSKSTSSAIDTHSVMKAGNA